MKFRLLPSTFNDDGSPSAKQHLACLVVDDRVAIDAGSLGMAANDTLRTTLRDVVLTHAHLDHVAGLPLFVDDLFASLEQPVRVHALPEVIDVLERDIFNWSVFPRFSELSIGSSTAITYHSVELDEEFCISELTFSLIAADHKVPSAGVVISDGDSKVVVSGDTASLDAVGTVLATGEKIKAIMVECAFPDALIEIARRSHHMTPAILAKELASIDVSCPVLVVNIKPNYRNAVVGELERLAIPRLEVMAVGRDYFW